MFLVVLFNAYTLDKLGQLFIKITSNDDFDDLSTYSDIMQTVFGKRGFVLGSLLIFAFNFGAMCVFLIVLNDILPYLLFSFFGFHFSMIFCLTLSIIVMTPMLLFKTLKSFWVSSLISDIAAIIIVFSFVFFPNDAKIKNHINNGIFDNYTLFSKLCQAFSTLSYVFCSHDSAVSV